MSGESFFTSDSLGTVAGCTAAIIIFTNTVRKLTRWTTPVIPFAISLVVGFVVAGVFAEKLNGPSEWLIALLNSCLLFLTASGGQEAAVIAGQAQSPGAVTKQSSAPVRFFSSWLRD